MRSMVYSGAGSSVMNLDSYFLMIDFSASVVLGGGEWGVMEGREWSDEWPGANRLGPPFINHPTPSTQSP